MSEPVTVLTRQRWWLWPLTIALLAVGVFAGPLVLAFAIVVLILALRAEWLIHRGRRLNQG